MREVSIDRVSRGTPRYVLLACVCSVGALACSDTCACGDPQPPASVGSRMVDSSNPAGLSVSPASAATSSLASTTALPSDAPSHTAPSAGSVTSGDATFTAATSQTQSDGVSPTEASNTSDLLPETMTPFSTDGASTRDDATGPSVAGSGDTADRETVFPAGVTKPKILIIGDSISAGPGCYKKYLDARLQSAGITEYEFVGEYSDDCGGEVRHGAVSCTTTSDYLQASFTLSTSGCPTGEHLGMGPLVQKYQPDLILLQLGVNDVWGGGQNVQNILSNYEALIGQARTHRPHVVFAVAQIHKIKTVGGCTEPKTPDSTAQALVDALPEWAPRVSTTSSAVFVVDLWTNSLVSESEDCVHPNDAGAQRMAENWYEGLRAILD